jgi:cytochrome c5
MRLGGQLSKGTRLAAVVVFVAVPGYVQTARAQHATVPAVLATSAASERALLDQYCVVCHNQRLKTAGLTLDQLDIAQMREHGEVWELD